MTRYLRTMTPPMRRAAFRIMRLASAVSPESVRTRDVAYWDWRTSNDDARIALRVLVDEVTA